MLDINLCKHNKDGLVSRYVPWEGLLVLWLMGCHSRSQMYLLSYAALMGENVQKYGRSGVLERR